MLRLTELRLPLDHSEDALRQAALRRLGIGAADLGELAIARRGYDARKPAAISLVYTLDVEVRDEAAVLRSRNGDPRIAPAPDTRYRFVARAPEPGRRRARWWSAPARAASWRRWCSRRWASAP